MKVTVVEVSKETGIKVRTRQGRVQSLDVYKRPALLHELRAGDQIQVRHKANHPYLVLID